MIVPSLFFLSAISATFVLVDRKDPMTDARQIAYAVNNEDGMLAIGCSVPHEIFVRIVPKTGYYGPGKALLWEPNGSYRFGTDQVVKPGWTFNSESFDLGNVLGTNSEKARFIDALARNTVLHVRYEASFGEVRTLSFLYEISPQQVKFVLDACDPKRVRAELAKMGSALVDAK